MKSLVLLSFVLLFKGAFAFSAEGFFNIHSSVLNGSSVSKSGYSWRSTVKLMTSQKRFNGFFGSYSVSSCTGSIHHFLIVSKK